MHLRSYRCIGRATVALALVLVLALPLAGTASAQVGELQNCAIGARYEPSFGYANIIRVYNSIQDQSLVQVQAAVCTNLISQGWFGVSKYGEWQRRFGGIFSPICGYQWPYGASVNVYAYPGYEWLARADCSAFYGGYLSYF